MSKNVIISVGLNGWGYLDRLLYLSKEETVFLDRDGNPVRQLHKEPSYTTRFGNEWESLKVDNYTVYTTTDERTITNIARVERISVSVGADRVVELLPFLQVALQKRDRCSLDILVAENGIQPSSPLAILCNDSRIHLSEAAIFCATLGQCDSLGIFSENLDHLPYDSVALGHELPLYGFVQEARFSDLLERKIYTYNCISAHMVYLGCEKGYADYAKVTNDIEITERIKRITEVINRCVITAYNVSIQEQTASSEMATRKFQNQNIKNTVARNVQDVERKLKLEERIRRSSSLMQGQGEYNRELLEVLVAAPRYGMKTKELSQDWNGLMDFYIQGVCEEWKRVLHRCK